MASKKFHIEKRQDNNLSFREFGNKSKKKMLYTNENSIDNNKIKNQKDSIKTYNNSNNINLNKKTENIFLKKIEKIKKGQMTVQNKLKRRIANYSVNNSFANFQKKFGNKLYNNVNINDKTFTTKPNNISKYKEYSINNNKSKNKHLIIECGYNYTHRDKYNISGDKYIKKKKAYISSLPCSTRKNLNMNVNSNLNTSNKKDKENEKDITVTSSKRTYCGDNSSLVSKYKNKIKPNIRASLYKNKQKNNNNLYNKISKTKIYTKRIIDNSSNNIAMPNTGRQAVNESALDKTSSHYKINSDLNTLDADIKDKNKMKTYRSKINALRKEKEKINENIAKNDKFNSIKVNKNNCLEKSSKNTLSTVNQNSNGSKNLNSNNYTSSTNTNKNNNSNKNAKNKARLQSCKFTNEQIYKLEKKIILNNNNTTKYKKLSEKDKKNIGCKYIQSSSTKERKNITFFGNYIKSNNLFLNSNANMNPKKKHYYTNSNISAYLNNNNNSAIIRNANNNMGVNNTNSKNINKTNKKRKHSLLYKNPIIKEADLINKIKIKLKNKPVTTLQSKGNSKTNIICDELLNISTKNSKQNQNYISTTNNTNINNKIIHNSKKIFINNIINVNSNENNINNNCCSYRVMDTDKLQSYKHQIINIPSRTPCLEYSFTNKSQKHIYQNQINSNRPPIKETIPIKSKNEIKIRDIKYIENNSNINNNKNGKKNNITKNLKNKDKKIKISKDLIKKEINSINNKKGLAPLYCLNNNQKNLSNIFQDLNLNSEVISENITIETNPSLLSTLKECTYYKQECEKLSSYITKYYQKHKEYPNTNQNFYKYGRILGKGAFGKVNLALHLASGRLVAIKSFNKKKLTTKRAKRKIKTEIEALSKLRNPFCTQIYDFFETETHILIVMEYVCGDLLGFIRKRAKISEPTAKIIFKQIIKGLQYIHKKKIVHRDIKLDNVLIDLTNTVKICDFGVCRILQPGDVMYEHCGTPAYIAPEIFKDEGYEGFSCDIWSAGVTLYYMLAGVQPFKANKIEDLKEIILKGVFEPIEEVSKEANDLIKGMLELNPSKRFTVEDVLKHPWLKNVNIKKRENLNIFTNAEKGLLSKYDVNYLSSPKEELIEVFTISNLETKEEKEEKGGTKSDILAPYNSYAIEPEKDFYPELKIENEICRFNFKAQLSNIKYELSNNQEFDNGIIKTIYNSVEGGNKKNDDEFGTENMNSLNLSLDSIETFTCGLCDDIIKDIEELIGYDRKYLVQCLRKNEINYATATYYLMLKDELNLNY